MVFYSFTLLQLILETLKRGGWYSVKSEYSEALKMQFEAFCARKIALKKVNDWLVEIELLN